MHGSSSVPQDLLAIINQYGGKMKETYGVPIAEIQEAIKFGVRKINIDTDIRLAMTGAPTSSAAAMTAWTCSRLLTLKAGMP